MMLIRYFIILIMWPLLWLKIALIMVHKRLAIGRYIRLHSEFIGINVRELFWHICVVIV